MNCKTCEGKGEVGGLYQYDSDMVPCSTCDGSGAQEDADEKAQRRNGNDYLRLGCGVTHYSGCACHEKAWRDRCEKAEAEVREWRESFEKRGLFEESLTVAQVADTVDEVCRQLEEERQEVKAHESVRAKLERLAAQWAAKPEDADCSYTDCGRWLQAILAGQT